jgi:hypothetical protein
MAEKASRVSIQDLVYNLDVGMGLYILRVLLYIGLVLVVAMLYTASQFKGLKNESAMDSAQIARNIAYGRGYTTRNISPASIRLVQAVMPENNPRIQNHPELIRPPVYPVMLSGVFRLARGMVQPYQGRGTYGPEQYFMIPINNFISIIAGIFVYLLARRIFDRRLAFLAMTIFYLSDIVWASSMTGTELPLVLLLTLLSFYSLLISADARDAGGAALRWIFPLLVSAGACAGAFLTRYGMIFLLPALLLYVGLRFQRGRTALILGFTALFVLLISPWLAWNFMLCGKPLGLAPYMMLNDSHNSWLVSLDPNFGIGQFFGRGVMRIWLSNVASFYSNDLHRLGHGLLGAFFIASFFYSFVRKAVRLLRWAVALGIILLLMVAGFYGSETIKLLYVFLPFAIIYGLAFFFLLLERLQLRFRVLEIALVSLVVVSSALPLAFTLLPPRASLPYPPYYPPFISYVSSLMEPGELMCTDMPWATAWYSDQLSLQLPEDINDFYDINDYVYRISGLYFTTITRDQPFIRTLRTGRYRTWFPVMGGQVPQDFPLSSGFPMNNLDQLFLTDYKRWEDAGPQQ